ncbi:MAG: hypothetical protein ACYDH9_10795 [Limisphaerales bacterium]
MKCLSLLITTAVAVFGAYGQTSETTAVQVSSQAPTYLYGGQASKLEGDIKRRGGDNFAWKGTGAVTWKVQIAKSGEYAVGLCHAAEPGAAGQELQIAGSGRQLNYTVRSTKGVFRGNMAEKKYKELGGNFTVIIRPGEGHFAVGPQDPTPVVNFIVEKTN